MGGAPMTTPVQHREWKPSAQDQPDTQGIIVSAYPQKLFASTFLVQFFSKDPNVAANPKGWLSDVVPRITYATGSVNPSLNIAISAAGLLVIDPDKIVFDTFSVPFQDGMTTKTKSKFLGDADDQHPLNWGWTDSKDDPHCVHAQLMFYADEQRTLIDVVAFESTKLSEYGLSVLKVIPQEVKLDANGMRREHFGFADGVSQPTLVDYDTIPVPQRTLHEIAAGEVVLGQKNTYGDPARGPFVSSSVPAAQVLFDGPLDGMKDLGRNGTYLVTRQLKQDVAAFWQNMTAASTGLKNEAGNSATATWLAEKAVGRTQNGYMLQPDRKEEAVPVPAGQRPPNDMSFFTKDRLGFGCPVTSHVRRANPRDGLAPDVNDVATIVQATNRHRIVRRGRIYGEPILDPMQDDAVDRGLLFHCLNSEIDRQFEFVQHTWLLNPMFGGAFQQSDPIVGPKCPFSIPAHPVRQQPVLETFIIPQGGGYFFIPSRRALQFFGAL
jgi:Dyp-type peroxidase family